ncbi:MAG: transposase [Caldilineaceae bacterium SB0661_bin_34]|nr:transposase [Caldilineaceae bacterium SB0661_bin_34]
MDLTVSTAEREAVLELLDGLQERAYRPRTLGADRGYDSKDCVRDIRARRVTPHVTRKKHLTIDGRTTRHTGYAVNLRLRKRVEVVFGWMKTVGDLQRTRYRGVDRTGWVGYLMATAYNLHDQTPGRAGDRGGPTRALGAYGPQKNSHVRTTLGISGSIGLPKHRFRAPSGCRCLPKPILQQPVSAPGETERKQGSWVGMNRTLADPVEWACDYPDGTPWVDSDPSLLPDRIGQ